MLQLFILGIAILFIFIKKWYDFSIFLISIVTIYKYSKLDLRHFIGVKCYSPIILFFKEIINITVTTRAIPEGINQMFFQT